MDRINPRASGWQNSRSTVRNPRFLPLLFAASEFAFDLAFRLKERIPFLCFRVKPEQKETEKPEHKAIFFVSALFALFAVN